MSIGLPLALQELLTQLSFLALCAFVNRLGLAASSGYGVASKIINFAMLIPSALMQSMASFVAQNVGAGNQKRAKQSMLTGIGVGLFFGCAVFALVMLKGDALAGFFSPDAEVVQKGFEYLKGFAPETILTAILFSMLGYFNGNNKTLWVMAQGLIQTLLVRLPFAYVMSIQPNASLTKIGLAAPVSTLAGVILNVGFYLYLDRKEKRVQRADKAFIYERSPAGSKPAGLCLIIFHSPAARLQAAFAAAFWRRCSAAASCAGRGRRCAQEWALRA